MLICGQGLMWPARLGNSILILTYVEKWVLKFQCLGRRTAYFTSPNTIINTFLIVPSPSLFFPKSENFSHFWYENYLVKGVFKVWVKLPSSLVSLVLLASHRSVQVNQGWDGYTYCNSKPKPYPINGLTECTSHVLGVRSRPIIIFPRIQNPKTCLYDTHHYACK